MQTAPRRATHPKAAAGPDMLKPQARALLCWVSLPRLLRATKPRCAPCCKPGSLSGLPATDPEAAALPCVALAVRTNCTHYAHETATAPHTVHTRTHTSIAAAAQARATPRGGGGGGIAGQQAPHCWHGKNNQQHKHASQLDKGNKRQRHKRTPPRRSWHSCSRHASTSRWRETELHRGLPVVRPARVHGVAGWRLRLRRLPHRTTGC
jgi:hypothetical protein